ncbi:MAG: helix-turn-helix transcriptional regulator [Bacteroidota bacterium]
MVKLLYVKLQRVTDYPKLFAPQQAMISQWLMAFGMIVCCGVLLVYVGIGKPWKLDTPALVWAAACVAGFICYKLGKFLSSPAQQPDTPEKTRCWNLLSVREVEVAGLLLTNLTNKEICARLFIEYNTLKTHTRSIYRKTQCNSRMVFIQRYKALPDETTI